MDGKLKQPQYLWDLITMRSLNEIEIYLDKMSFGYKQTLDDGLLYSSMGEALIINMENQKPRMITYKTNSPTDFTKTINHAKRNLQYQIINDTRDGHEHTLRLDGEGLALLCRSVASSESISYSLRLLFKTSLAMGKVSVAISPLHTP